ncbi:hypothetical protein AB0F52_30965 [Amycolatopsis sp. NPDC024027]|uniref:hypothetical protein n=1 Tax=Amycolatopsis sp. NPDC024027 TaxID=3154327 RepID=UPI0033C06FE8
MNRKRLFVSALEELDGLVRKGQSNISDYELLRISALLRQLILDAQPLYAQINREYRVSVTFRSSYPASMTDQDLPEPPFEGLDSPLPIGTKTLSRDDFLRRHAGYTRPHSFTVKDLILYGANVAGGVHAGSPKSPEHATLHDTAEVLVFFGKEPALLELLGIGQVVLRSLSPLYGLVKAETSRETP